MFDLRTLVSVRHILRCYRPFLPIKVLAGVLLNCRYLWVLVLIIELTILRGVMHALRLWYRQLILLLLLLLLQLLLLVVCLVDLDHWLDTPVLPFKRLGRPFKLWVTLRPERSRLVRAMINPAVKGVKSLRFFIFGELTLICSIVCKLSIVVIIGLRNILFFFKSDCFPLFEIGRFGICVEGI